jgi:crotonobetainyl-CoA:carnitine CoA-transferase CaiB-like acyl-CoA transferase
MNQEPSSAWQPLAGLTIIDFSMLLPGPLTTLIFADLGANIIKVEPPGGDYARGMGSNLFHGANRNKRSLILDLKSPAAAEVVTRLATHGNVAIEGFRPGVAARLGIGAQTLQEINPKLVYCSISGFGQTGPMKNHAGHDLAYLAMAGSLSQSGHWREPSRRSSTPVADMAGGTYAAVAILAALRGIDDADKAPVIDISLYESMLYMNAIRFGFEQDEPTQDHLYPTNDLFATSDGQQIALTIIEEKFWRNFVAAIGTNHPHFGSEQYATEAGRRDLGDKLMTQLDELIMGNTADHWIALFEAADVPATLCITPRQALQTEHSRARALHVDTPSGAVLPFPAAIEGRAPNQQQQPPPELGQHNEVILDELGFQAIDIERLVRVGAVLPG